MDNASLSELRTWLTEAGLAGKSETELLDGFCRRALDAGLPIARAAIVIDTLHPVHEGRAFLWRREGGQTQTELVVWAAHGKIHAKQREYSCTANDSRGKLIKRLTSSSDLLTKPSNKTLEQRGRRRRRAADRRWA